MKSLLLPLLLLPTLAQATLLTPGVTERIVDRIVWSECSWTDVVEVVTTSSTQEYVSAIVLRDNAQVAYANLEGGNEAGPGYTYDFVKYCYDYKPQGIETYHTGCPGLGIGNTGSDTGEAFTQLSTAADGYWKTRKDTQIVTLLRIHDLCKTAGNCLHGIPINGDIPLRDMTLPEPGTFVLVLIGVAALCYTRKQWNENRPLS